MGDISRDQFVLAAEVRVQRGLGRTGLGEHAIYALRSRGRGDRRELHDDSVLETHAGVDEASAATERQQQAQYLHAAVAELPPAQREAVEHLKLKEWSLAETAAYTGRTTDALKVNLHRALKALRRQIIEVD